MKAHLCRDYGRPGCLGTIDPAFTMDFSDIGEHPIFWCSWCGPQAHSINAAIEDAAKNRPGFVDEFKAAIQDAHDTPR